MKQPDKIKVTYNDGKCYQCNGNNLSDIEKNGSVGVAICIDCTIPIVLYDFITKDEYKQIYSLQKCTIEIKSPKILKAGTTANYDKNDLEDFCLIL